MKILHITPSVSILRGGPSQAALEMVHALRQQGVDAEIATTNDHGDGLLDVPLQQRTDYEGVPTYFFPRFSPPIAALREFAFSAAMTQWVWRHIERYDLLHVHAIFSYPSTMAMAIARRKRVPYIVRTLGQLCEWSMQQSALKKKFYLSLVERQNLSQSQAVHFTSAQEQDEAKLLGLDAPGLIIPHGLNIQPTIPDAHQKLRQHLGLPLDEPIILFLSRLHPKKGLEYLIPALSQLQQHRFTFLLAGRGDADYEAEIQSLLDSVNLRHRTHMMGFVKGEEKNLVLQGSDLFALTSHSENFGISVLEALAAGLPVLITPGVALSEVVGQHNLGYISDLTVPAIQSALSHYFQQPDLAQEIRNRARQFVAQQYSWDGVARTLQQNYLRILKNPVSPLEL
jgi:glycosyltransferase involved in cell wall biosynthesis